MDFWLTSLLLSGVPRIIWGLPVQLPLEIIEDNEIDQDIFAINEALGLDLFEGDIKPDIKSRYRNAKIGKQHRWPLPIPYILEDNLDINAKGLILKAFEQFRLKSCIDFKPWEGEANYISVYKGTGCWSHVGNQRTGEQKLSIGRKCVQIATIEHEFLHALGFWHEQSRSDRDDYVTIMLDRVKDGEEHNFKKYDDKVTDFLNVPYDYASIMHYDKTAFGKGTEPTIITNIPSFMNVIGQEMDFSESDIKKLNQLYNCSSSLSFLDTCSFETDNVCGMIQRTADNADWQRRTQISSGPRTDHTYARNCKETGYFMHFDTSAGRVRDKAILESRYFYPKRRFQCLQFYYYNSGSKSDQLNILVKEYTEANPNGVLRLVKTIQGSPVHFWELYHIPLKIKNKFRVVFEGIKGSSTSNGGLSIDDINLSETQCPHHVWHIRNFMDLLSSTPANTPLYSPPFYSPKGYAFQIALYVKGATDPPSMGIYVGLIKGANDDRLRWPCPWQQITMVLLDQHRDIRQRMSMQKSLTTDPQLLESSRAYTWDRPDKVGVSARFSNGTKYKRGPKRGTASFIPHERLRSREFIKDDGIFILTTVEDISHLISTKSRIITTNNASATKRVTRPLADMHTNYVCGNKRKCIVVKDKPVSRNDLKKTE